MVSKNFKDDNRNLYHSLSKDELYQIIQNINDALYITSFNEDMVFDHFVEVNKAAHDQLGYSREEFLNLVPTDIIDPNSLNGLKQELQQLLQGNHTTRESTHITKQGKKIAVEVSNRLITLVGEQYILSTVRDISNRKETEVMLEKTLIQFESLFKYNPDIIFTLNPEGTFININPSGEKILEYPLDELLGMSYTSIIAPEDLDETTHHFQKILAGNTVRFESAIFTKDNQKVELNITSVPILFQNKIAGVIGIARDITLQKQTEKNLKESEQRYRSLFENNIDAVLTFDLEGNFIEVNVATELLTGYSSDELIGTSFKPLIVPEEQANTYDMFNKAIQGYPNHYETVIFNKHGERVFLHVTVTPIIINNKITGIHCIGKNITEKKSNEAKINHMAFYDHLTDLPNQSSFQRNSNQALEKAKKDNKIIAIFFLDLDRFKFINDYLGHDVGDLLLQKVASRLSKSLSHNASAYRYAGDEFIVLIENTSKSQISLVAEKILHSIVEPFNLEGFEAILTASIGISVYPTDGDTIKTLIKRADNAMYHAKQKGKHNYQFYNSSVANMTTISLKTESLLHKAIEREEFILQYQPQLDLKTNTIYGVEALVRWKSQELGMVSPGDFIPIAEETGLIVPIGEWVLRTACKQNKKWQEQGYRPMVVSVNLSMRQFYQTDFIEKITSILSETQLDPEYLELEITESVAMHADTASNVLKELRKIGVKVAIDDFGTGYSSLSYLKRFRIDHLKIDQSFVQDIMNDVDNRDIISTIIKLGHNLNLKVVAEGVETEEQLDFLKKHHCDILQGYYFSRPVDPGKIAEILGEWWVNGDGSRAAMMKDE